MPYYVHARNMSDPNDILNTGRRYETKIRAIEARADDESVSYVVSYQEQDIWQERERARFRSGTYTQPRWSNDLNLTDDTRYHFAHVSLKQPGKIGYTPDDTFGHEDRQLVITPGRYLERFYPNLTPQQRDYYCGNTNADLAERLQYAYTADDIAAVYCTDSSFSSCMDRAHGWTVETNPVRAYGSSDLALAYLGAIDVRIHARALVRVSDKTYSRLYGQIGRIDALLVAAGYRQNGDGGFVGAKIHAIKHGSRYRCPYVDWSGSADLTYTRDDDGTRRSWFELRDDDDGEYVIQYQDGYARANEQETYYCNRDGCDNTRNEDDDYCNDCYDHHSSCESCSETIWSDTDEYH